MADDEILKVIRYAADLGMHGVLILSPVCDGCDDCHEFSLVSDLTKVPSIALVRHFASVIDDTSEGFIEILPHKEH